jgi:rod shape-determining protein MreC
VGILADQRIQPGEKVLTAGGDQIFPRGLAVGVVQKIVRDADRDGFIDVLITPAAHIDRLDEVLVITSTGARFSPEAQQDIATSEALKGAEAAAIKDQKKASEIMAERLPGLTDPNAPAANPATTPAPGQPASTPPAPVTPAVPKVLPAQRPDRYSPGSAAEVPTTPTPSPRPKLDRTTTAPAGTSSSTAPRKAPNSNQPGTPRRNP